MILSTVLYIGSVFILVIYRCRSISRRSWLSRLIESDDDKRDKVSNDYDESILS